MHTIVLGPAAPVNTDDPAAKTDTSSTARP